MSSTTDKIKGLANEAVGNVKQAAGKATGNDKLVAEGIAENKAEKWPKAIAALQKAVKLRPDAVASRELAKALYATDKLEPARMQLEKATKIDPRDADSFLYFGMVLADLDRKAEAKRAYERFLSLEPPGSSRAREITSVLKALDR